jgi:hypothetical protein
MPASAWRWPCWHGGCGEVLGARARRFAIARRASAATEKNEATLDQKVTAVPVSGVAYRKASSVKVAPRVGNSGRILLASAVVAAPSGDNSFKKLSDAVAAAMPGCVAGATESADCVSRSRCSINQGGNFLSQIRSVTELRKFVALQTIARCGKQELPRRRNSAAIHETP